MAKYWKIVAKSGFPELQEDQWIDTIDSRSELVAIPAQEVPNPFIPGEMMTVSPPATSAQLISNSRKIGDFYWASDDSPCLFLEIVDTDDETNAIEMASEIADMMNADLIAQDH